MTVGDQLLDPSNMPQLPSANGNPTATPPVLLARMSDQSSPGQQRHLPIHHNSTHGFVEQNNRSLSSTGTASPSIHSSLQRVLSIDRDALQRPASSQAAFQDGHPAQQRMKRRNQVLDAKTKLKKEEDGVVKRRDGGVLARG